MIERSAKHSTFVVEKRYPHSPARVFAAWASPSAKAAWFPAADEFDFRVGGREYNRGGPPGGPVFTMDACYQDIVPDRRIVYSYTLDMGDVRLSVSVTTVEFKPEEGGTRVVFTEQGVFLDGHDTPEQREHGTRLLLDKLGDALDGQAAAATATQVGDREIAYVRIFDAPRALVFDAWTKPELLATWWGPRGFTSTFETFELEPGGTWRFTMHGPDGVDYPNTHDIIEVIPQTRIRFEHTLFPHFIATATFEDVEGGKTKLAYVTAFRETPETFEKVKAYAVPGAEQMMDRLAELLANR